MLLPNLLTGYEKKEQKLNLKLLFKNKAFPNEGDLKMTSMQRQHMNQTTNCTIMSSAS